MRRLFQDTYPVVYGMFMPPRLILSHPTINRVEKHSKDTPLQIIASFADSLAPSFNFFMMQPPRTIPTPALGTMMTPGEKKGRTGLISMNVYYYLLSNYPVSTYQFKGKNFKNTIIYKSLMFVILQYSLFSTHTANKGLISRMCKNFQSHKIKTSNPLESEQNLNGPSLRRKFS